MLGDVHCGAGGVAGSGLCRPPRASRCRRMRTTSFDRVFLASCAFFRSRPISMRVYCRCVGGQRGSGQREAQADACSPFASKPIDRPTKNCRMLFLVCFESTRGTSRQLVARLVACGGRIACLGRAPTELVVERPKWLRLFAGGFWGGSAVRRMSMRLVVW